jgi:hypothetical protein
LVRVKLLAPSVLVEPLNTLSVSGLVRLNVTVPPPSSRTVTVIPPQPEAELSGMVTTDAPDCRRIDVRRSSSVVVESQRSRYGDVLTGDVLASMIPGETAIGAELF